MAFHLGHILCKKAKNVGISVKNRILNSGNAQRKKKEKEKEKEKTNRNVERQKMWLKKNDATMVVISTCATTT